MLKKSPCISAAGTPENGSPDFSAIAGPCTRSWPLEFEGTSPGGGDDRATLFWHKYGSGRGGSFELRVATNIDWLRGTGQKTLERHRNAGLPDFKDSMTLASSLWKVCLGYLSCMTALLRTRARAHAACSP